MSNADTDLPLSDDEREAVNQGLKGSRVQGFTGSGSTVHWFGFTR